MSSFFSNCPECGVLHAKASPCPDCGYQNSVVKLNRNPALITEFADRLQIHQRNSAISMLLKLGTGLCGMLAAVAWFRIIYFGSIGAFILVGLLSVLSTVLTTITVLSERWFPTALQCPQCQARLDKYGEFGDECPSCQSQLRGEFENVDDCEDMEEQEEATASTATVEEEERELVSV